MLNLHIIQIANLGLAEVRIVDFTRFFNGGVLHTKLWVVDQKHFYVGSANMDWRSITEVIQSSVYKNKTRIFPTYSKKNHLQKKHKSVGVR